MCQSYVFIWGSREQFLFFEWNVLVCDFFCTINFDSTLFLPLLKGREAMKRIICATLILFFAFTTTVSAHTGLTSSSPAGGEDITEDVYEIVLEFNSKIESTSTVKVFDESKEEIIISTTQVSGDMMTGGFLSPLDKGTYAVEWKIIGTDGHPIQGTYSFMVSQFEEPVVTEEKQEMSVVPKKESNRRTCRAVNRRFIKISIE